MRGGCRSRRVARTLNGRTGIAGRGWTRRPHGAHGRIETRRIAARDLLPGTFASCAHARQAFRVIRERTIVKTDATSTEIAYGITSATAEHAGPDRLLAWNRGHWQVENGNHYRRDATFGEDASRQFEDDLCGIERITDDERFGEKLADAHTASQIFSVRTARTA